MELHELVLGTPGLLEWLGQHFTTASAIIGASHDPVDCVPLMHITRCAAARFTCLAWYVTSFNSCACSCAQTLWHMCWR
jgi:hypothetical protein